MSCVIIPRWRARHTRQAHRMPDQTMAVQNGLNPIARGYRTAISQAPGQELQGFRAPDAVCRASGATIMAPTAGASRFATRLGVRGRSDNAAEPWSLKREASL